MASIAFHQKVYLFFGRSCAILQAAPWPRLEITGSSFVKVLVKRNTSTEPNVVKSPNKMKVTDIRLEVYVHGIHERQFEIVFN
jgi:hypothetical protein